MKVHETFLKWKMQTKKNPKDVMEQLNFVRQGTELLNIGLEKKYNNDFFAKLKFASDFNKSKDLIMRFVCDYDNMGKVELLRGKFKVWRGKAEHDKFIKGVLVKIMADIPSELKQEYIKKYMSRWWDAKKQVSHGGGHMRDRCELRPYLPRISQTLPEFPRHIV